MNYLIRISAIFLFTIALQKVSAQTSVDKTDFVANYGKVMAFIKQPYLHYNTVTTMNAIPVFEPKDTATLVGEFFKYLDNFYSNNGLEEIYVQDSFLIRVNHERKTIWISKVDRVAEKSIDLLPASAKNMQASLLKNQTVSQRSLHDSILRIDFITKPDSDTKAIMTSMGLEYNKNSFLPTAMQITAKIRQPEDQETIEELEKYHIDSGKLIEIKDGSRFLVRTQQLNVAFKNINNTREVAQKIPSWKSVLDYNPVNNEFIPTAFFSTYEVTLTF